MLTPPQAQSINPVLHLGFETAPESGAVADWTPAFAGVTMDGLG